MYWGRVERALGALTVLGEALGQAVEATISSHHEARRVIAAQAKRIELLEAVASAAAPVGEWPTRKAHVWLPGLQAALQALEVPAATPDEKPTDPHELGGVDEASGVRARRFPPEAETQAQLPESPPLSAEHPAFLDGQPVQVDPAHLEGRDPWGLATATPVPTGELSFEEQLAAKGARR